MTAIGLLIAFSAQAQTWEIGNQVMTFTDPSRGNRQIETQIFYPADVAGTNVALGSPSDQKYPVLVFGHDQDVPYTDYFYIWNKFARYGFICAFPTTEMGANPNIEEYAKDLAFVAQQFNIMRFTPGSFYYKRHNSKSCLIGHGTGGSAAIIGMQYYSATTLVALTPTETTPSAISAATLVTKPTVIFSGDEDCVAPLSTNQEPMFNNIDSDCKTLVNFFEAAHCHFSMNGVVCSNTEVLCQGTPSTFQQTCTFTNYLLISFLRYYLKSNAPALDKFEWKLQNKTNIWSYIFACNVMARVGDEDESMDAPEELEMSLYPNPVKKTQSMKMSINSETASKATLYISNTMGQVVLKNDIEIEEMENEFVLPVEELRSGYYMLSVVTETERMSKPLIIQ